MKSRIFVVILCIFIFKTLGAQSFTGQTIENQSKEILSELFTNYEVVRFDIDAINASLNSRSTVKKLQLSSSRYHWDLMLFEYDLFAKNYFLSKSGDQGVLKQTRNKDLRTFKANSTNPRAGLSCMTIAKDFMYGYIEEAGVKVFYEPLYGLDPLAPRDMVVIYSERDVKPHANKVCGFDEFKNHLMIADPHEDHGKLGSRSACYTVDIALACDKTIHDNKGGVPQSEAFVTGVLNNVQTNYDNEFAHAVEFSITTIFVATTTAGDPWNGINNINTHLDIHRSWANGGGYGASYAVATAWTRKYTSGAIGLAWVGSVCTGFRYNVCSDFGGGAQSLRVLQAHELGHNFNCQHDAAGSNTIMAPSVNNSVTWSAASIAAVNAFLPTRGCLGACSSGNPPETNFQGIPTSVCVIGKVNFTDLSTNQPTSWLWTFPGGSPSTSTVQNPMVTYNTRGIYDVTLRATNSFGSNTVTFNSYIDVEQKPILTNFTFFLTEKLLSITSVQQLYGETYLWKFGDGNTSTEELPVHEYEKDGVYNLELTISNRCGTSSKTVRITVVSPVSADFTSDIQRGCAQFKVKFKNLSSDNATIFNWEFPGGVPDKSTLKDPIVTYPNKGVFDVTLTARNSIYSEQRKYSKYITADTFPVSDFSSDPPVGNSIQFTNHATDADSLFWSFGDGKKSTEKDPNHLYPGPGKYNVCLIAKGTCGRDTFCNQVEIANKLTAGFIASPNSGCVPYTVKFKNASTGAKSYFWKFQGGNPSTSTDTEPEVVYQSRGDYDVELIAIDGNDSSRLEQKSYISVEAMPDASYQFGITGLTVNFSNSSKYGDSYFWDFGDNQNSTEINPSHTYKAEGDYKVSLKVTNECGTVETLQEITVLLIPRVGFNAKLPICAGDYLTFSDQSSKDVIEWNWQFEHGKPATSTDKNPRIYFDVPGLYTVKLSVKNSNGENSITKVGYVEVLSSVLCPDKSKKKRRIESPLNDDGRILDTPDERTSLVRTPSMMVYPNPVSNNFIVNLSGDFKSEFGTLNIIDLTGKSVFSKFGKITDIKSENYTTNNLEAGVYLVKFNDGIVNLSTKLMIIK